MRAAFFALWAVMAATPARAEDPCAKFTEALAYNSCLARQGPASRAVHVGKAPANGAAQAARRPRAHGAIVKPRGRSELVFSPGK